MSAPAASDVLASMLAAFQPLLPAQVPGLPQPSLSMARAQLRPSGIGSIIGTVEHGAMGALEQHAIRVKAQLRFTLWGFVAAEVDQAVTALTGQVFAQLPALGAAGVLRLDFDGSSPPEETRQPVAWRRFADYDVLYESSYQDIGDAVGLILPIQAQEQASGTNWTIGGDFARWDDAAAPTFSLRGPARLAGLAALSFFADPLHPPAGGVAVTRSFDGAGPPTDAGTLAAFLAQTTAATTTAAAVAPARSVFVAFASLADLLAQFAPDGAAFAMGDRDADGVPDQYVPTRLAFPAPLLLDHVADRLELSFSQPKFDRTGVVYLRALRQGS
jgi:hypothetical protein